LAIRVVRHHQKPKLVAMQGQIEIAVIANLVLGANYLLYLYTKLSALPEMTRLQLDNFAFTIAVSHPKGI